MNEYYSQCIPADLCYTPQFGQCGGIDAKTQLPWPKEKQCCPPSFVCDKQDDYYSQCNPDTVNATCALGNAQCGGFDTQQPPQPWGSLPTEFSCCIPGYKCVKDNDYYSGCKPAPVCTNPATGSVAASTTTSSRGLTTTTHAAPIRSSAR